MQQKQLADQLSGRDDGEVNGLPMDSVRQYHERTKHSFYAYAKGPETLDWDSQPNPFRSFEGAQTFPLALEDSRTPTSYFDVINRPLPVLPITRDSIASFLRYSLGLTAWKQYGPDKWSLRVNPSSGNLHPSEAYLLSSDNLEGLGEGVFHYDVEHHQLEKRANKSSLSIPKNSFCIGLTSVVWRELWKYGERGFRYTQLDIGHAISSLVISARDHGWQVAVVSGLGEDQLSSLLGLDVDEYRAVEQEIPECLLWIGGDIKQSSELPFRPESAAVIDWCGVPNRLGERSLYQWHWADKVAQASCEKPQKIEKRVISETLSGFVGVEEGLSFPKSVLGRRSAQAFNRESISLQQFKTLIQSLLVFKQPLFSQSFSPMDFVIMVHRVEQLEPGIYILPSQPEHTELLKSEFTKWPQWKAMEVLASDAPILYQLTAANVQKATATLCCQQAIASDSAFTIGFLAHFDKSLERFGASAYRHLFWQAGMLSHQLYMSAAASQLAATGIGCFFDDPWMGLLGDAPDEIQMLYATAVGHPVVDERITSFSGYHHLPLKGIT